MWGSPTFLHETVLNGNTTTILAEASPLKHTRLHLFLVKMVIKHMKVVGALLKPK